MTTSDHITPPHKALARTGAVAGIKGLTLHSQRRSVGSLSQWLEIPTDGVAQIQGRKPSVTAEKHSRVRPLDLPRVHHKLIEAWVPEKARVMFERASEPGRQRAVVG